MPSNVFPQVMKLKQARPANQPMLRARGMGPFVVDESLLDARANPLTISGITRDSVGAALGNCIVQMFETNTDRLVREITSDGSGAFSFTVGTGQQFYIVAYKAGSPDVAGTTANTLAGA